MGVEKNAGGRELAQGVARRRRGTRVGTRAVTRIEVGKKRRTEARGGASRRPLPRRPSRRPARKPSRRPSRRPFPRRGCSAPGGWCVCVCARACVRACMYVRVFILYVCVCVFLSVSHISRLSCLSVSTRLYCYHCIITPTTSRPAYTLQCAPVLCRV